MRSQNLGIVGLALMGVITFAPQQAAANAYYHVDLDTDMNVSLDGSGTISIQNYVYGVNQSTSIYSDAGGVSTINATSNSANSTGASASSDLDILLTGVAIGDTRAGAIYSSTTGSGPTGPNPTSSNLLGTVFDITDIGAGTYLSLDLTINYLLATWDGGNATTYAYGRWALTYATRAAGSTGPWSAWQPNCGTTSNGIYCPGGTMFGDENYAAPTLGLATSGGAADRVIDGTGENAFVYNGTALLNSGLDYRFRLALAVRGSADSNNSATATPPSQLAPVPLPAALPMLGAAMAGLGLFAARRRKS